jgi:hypothetical protein
MSDDLMSKLPLKDGVAPPVTAAAGQTFIRVATGGCLAVRSWSVGARVLAKSEVHDSRVWIIATSCLYNRSNIIRRRNCMGWWRRLIIYGYINNGRRMRLSCPDLAKTRNRSSTSLLVLRTLTCPVSLASALEGRAPAFPADPSSHSLRRFAPQSPLRGDCFVVLLFFRNSTLFLIRICGCNH